MNWAAWGPTIVAIVTAIFTAGALVGRVKDQEKLLGKHDARLDGHDVKLGDHATQLAEARAFRDGFNAGRKHQRES